MAISLQTADQIVSFVISISAVQLNKFPIISSPKAVQFLRGIYIFSVVAQVLLLYYIKLQIDAKQDKREFKCPPEPSIFGTSDSTELINITIMDYDTDQRSKQLRNILIQAIPVFFLHFKWNITQPLIIQSINFVKNFIFNPLYRAHLYSMNIQRPFEKNFLFEESSEKVIPSPATENIESSSSSEEEQPVKEIKEIADSIPRNMKKDD